MKNARLWMAATFEAIVLMSLGDELSRNATAHYRVEIWVCVLFLLVGLTLWLVHRESSLVRACLLGYLVGGILGLYNLVWVIAYAVNRGPLPPSVGLYPFGVTITWTAFWVLTTGGVFLMFACERAVNEGGRAD